MNRFLGALAVIAGYTLVYAAVAASGEFAADPWRGLTSDAYTAKSGGTSSSSSGGTAASSGTGSSSSGKTKTILGFDASGLFGIDGPITLLLQRLFTTGLSAKQKQALDEGTHPGQKIFK